MKRSNKRTFEHLQAITLLNEFRSVGSTGHRSLDFKLYDRPGSRNPPGERPSV